MVICACSRRRKATQVFRAVALAVGLAVLAGCATSAGTAKALDTPSKAPDLTRFKSVSVQTSAKKELVLTSADHERIVKIVQVRIREKAGTRFTDVTAGPTDL